MKISILAYPGCMATDMFALSDYMLIANHMAAALAPGQHRPISVRIAAARPGPVTMAGGHLLQVARLAGRCELLVVPGLDVEARGRWPQRMEYLLPEIEVIRRRARTGTPVAAVCLGAFLLAEADIIHGRSVATAWMFERQFAKRYPTERLKKNALLCEDQGLITTGAGSSVFDLAQFIAQRHFGPDISRAAARATLLGGVRSSQQPYVDPALLSATRQTMAGQVDHWLTSQLAEPYNLTKLASAFNLSTRTLLRRYREETGATPLATLQEARVEAAKQLLEVDDKSWEQIVSAVGYQDVATFSRLFRRTTGDTPMQYRRRFQG